MFDFSGRATPPKGAITNLLAISGLQVLKQRSSTRGFDSLLVTPGGALQPQGFALERGIGRNGQIPWVIGCVPNGLGLSTPRPGWQQGRLGLVHQLTPFP
jgi:hypothetical protein